MSTLATSATLWTRLHLLMHPEMIKTLLARSREAPLSVYISYELWTLELEWTGQREFVKEPLREWVVDGKRAGKTRRAGPFTFATVDAAGHMVPYDKPVEAEAMVLAWLEGEL